MDSSKVAGPLDAEELRRYSRHLILPEVGPKGQQKLKAARVLVVGVGGLGSPAALYLAAAGVGTIGIADFDVVDLSNLQRQILYSTTETGQAKSDCARNRLLQLNPSIRVLTHPARLTAQNVLDILPEYDLVLDGTDNFPARYLINDACAFLGKPYIYGSVFRFEGQVSVFNAGSGPCYRCLHPQPPSPGIIPSCAEAGVLGVLPGVIGALQATEALKLILGIGTSLIGELLAFDALDMEWRKLRLSKNPLCPLCGENPSIRSLADCRENCASNTEIEPVPEISIEELKARLDRGETPLLLDVREPHERPSLSLPNACLIPLGQLQYRLEELHPKSDIVVICRSGSRSAQAVRFLRSAGFKRAISLSGGMLAWAQARESTL